MCKLIYLMALIISFVCSCSVVRTGADLQRMAADGRPVSVTIKNDIDLKGKTLKLAQGSKLVFKGGSISNCNIIFDGVKIQGRPQFKDCTYKGRVYIKKIDDVNFASRDDQSTFLFLIANAIANGAECQINRDYRLDMSAAPSSGLIVVKDCTSGADISFNGHSVYNTKAFATPHIQPVIALKDVKSVTLRDCNFHDVDAHNTHNFRNSAGCTFVHCYGDCESINLLNCSQENGDGILRSGVYTHSEDNPSLTPRKGLTNSVLKVRSRNAGYGLAIYCGDNLDIDVDAYRPHRGFYCAGVSNSRIQYSGFSPLETMCHILIKDAVYRKTGSSGVETLDMKGCHDLKINAKIDDLQQKETVIIFQSYGSGKKEKADFTFRSGKCHHYNIDFSAIIKHYPESGFFLICNCAAESGALNESDIYGCKLSNITIHDVNFSGMAKKYMCSVSSCFDADITIRDCQVAEVAKGKKDGFNIQVNGDAVGKIKVKNSVVGNVLVKEKENGTFDVELEDTPIIHGTEYIDVKPTKKALVRIK